MCILPCALFHRSALKTRRATTALDMLASVFCVCLLSIRWKCAVPSQRCVLRYHHLAIFIHPLNLLHAIKNNFHFYYREIHPLCPISLHPFSTAFSQMFPVTHQHHHSCSSKKVPRSSKKAFFFQSCERRHYFSNVFKMFYEFSSKTIKAVLFQFCTNSDKKKKKRLYCTLVLQSQLFFVVSCL